MKFYRYIYLAIFVAAAVFVCFLELPLWVKVVILAWTAAPLAINEYQESKKTKAAAEQESHSSNSVEDQVLHAYKERA